jgi:hypothetical protein
VKPSNTSIPHAISRRLLDRGARGEKRAVVVFKNGKPSSVWGFEEYIARQELTKQVEPWKHRITRDSDLDPLGAVDGTLKGPLTRDEIYED